MSSKELLEATERCPGFSRAGYDLAEDLGAGSENCGFTSAVDLRKIFWSEHPFQRFHVLLDLLRPRGSGDHTGYDWVCRQPTQRQL